LQPPTDDTAAVLAEPAAAAAAASLEGLDVAVDVGLVERDERSVLLVTDTGLEDVGAAKRAAEAVRLPWCRASR